MSFWKSKKVLVTGGAGFIGSHLVEALIKADAIVRVADNMENGSVDNLETCSGSVELIQKDLTSARNCMEVLKGVEVVFNLAAKVGGIEYNIKHPSTMFTQNILLNTLMLDAACRRGVERYLCVSSACVYPRHCTIPTPESEGFKDEPEPTNRAYGWAKRMAEIQAQTFASEFGMRIAIVRPYNTYGPRDHFEPEKSHVIPAIIRRIFDKEDPLVVWGDGEQTRAFVYVTDLVRGMLLAIEKYPEADPLNIGTEEEIKIKDLVKLIVKFSGKSPSIFFDSTKPSGQLRRNADITKAKNLIGYRLEVSLEDGLEKTLGWYTAKERNSVH
ncbi:MAG: NAD-dependent epimerase/dehydratase family protein [Dehalococcoidales bacterium]|nr:NAD-dependent epimerase/dehydratase family protein [Dehalococcoidales bacterium]